MNQPLRVGLAGFGTIGRDLARRLTADAVPGVRLAAVAARDRAKAAEALRELAPSAMAVPVADLPDHADVVVECASAEAVADIARPVLTAGKTLVVLSSQALSVHPDLIDLARRHGGRIRVPSAVMPGLDAVRSAAEGAIGSVTLRMWIRPDALAKEDYIRRNGIDVFQPLTEPMLVCKGTAREVAAAFPGHLNMVTALALAGIGMDRTMVEAWIQPDLPGPIVRVELEADDLVATMTFQNRRSPENPRTSRIVALSVIAALRSMVSPIQIGS